MLLLKKWCVIAGSVAANASLLLTSSAFGLSILPSNAGFVDAQTNIFLPDEVTEVYVTIDPDDFNFLVSNPDSDVQRPATIRWKNSLIDETHTDVNFGPRGGNFTIGATRKSWKLDFNDLVPGRDLHGLESINLNGDHNDPTLLRRTMAHEFKMRMGLPTSRTHYAALFINGDLLNIAIHTEHIDEEFCDNWFGTKTGNLYKCVSKGAQADLVYRPAEDYQTLGGGLTYEEKNNAPLSDYTDLKDFIRFLHEGTDPQFHQSLESYINIDNVLRYMATNVAVGSWDDYWYGSNNYYMYRNPNTNRFEWIPYDYDNCLGMDYFGTNWSSRHFDEWGEGGYGTSPSPLIEAIKSHSEWRRQYRRYLLDAATILEDPAFQARLAHHHNLIKPWFDGTIANGGITGTSSTSGQHNPHFLQYNNPTNYQGGGFHTQGILPFIQQRATNIRSQIQSFISPTNPVPAVYINEVMSSNTTVITDNAGEFEDWIELYNDSNSTIDLSGWHLSDDPLNPMQYVIPSGVTIPAKGFLVIWADDTAIQDAPGHIHANFRLGAGGETITLSHNESNGRVLVDYLTYPVFPTNRSYGRYTDGTETVQIFEVPTPGAANSNATGGGGGEPRTPPRLFINEFMADNGGSHADSFGEFDDWVEIYNDENVAVDLSGLHLTDTLANPTKWPFPAGTSIPAKGYLVVWCDNGAATQSTPAEPHTNFALSKGGEALGLFDNEENDAQPIHTFTFGAQITDVTFGLLPDGEGSPQQLNLVTPGASNAGVTSVGWLFLGE